MIFAGRAQPDQLDARIGKAANDILPLGFVERRFDAVLVPAAQLDAGEAGLLQVLDQRGQVPIGAPHVGDKSELHGIGGG